MQQCRQSAQPNPLVALTEQQCLRCRQQYVVMPEQDLVAVPDKMDDQTAAQFYVSRPHVLMRLCLNT